MAYQPPPPPMGSSQPNKSAPPNVSGAVPQVTNFSNFQPSTLNSLELNRNSSAPNVAQPFHQPSTNAQQTFNNPIMNGKPMPYSSFNGPLPSQTTSPSMAFSNGPSEPRYGPQGQVINRSVSSPPGSGPIAAHQVPGAMPPVLQVGFASED